ncbi:MAG: transcriptional regulator [Candidatus Bathyarchaeota archaeon]|nr:MAG: transcriptional regulator [Candidatus Bathyarchaeota archaeon]
MERKALQIILEAGEDGILQSEMWKKLGVTSREGSRLALKFEEKGAVVRERVLHKGRWTYKLFSQTKLVSLESIRDCPCIVCEGLDKCFSGGQISPIHCQQLTLWMDPSLADSIE